MRLQALEIQGFKSFPDKTRLEFGSGITAVVGPNGSGKSNISDAVRWVLGEQSTKTLRGGKMEDVIFGGTQTRKPMGFSMVRLTIDNTDGVLPDRQDVVSVSRHLYRSGESEYRIDGTTVRLRDVHEMFMDTGLGRDGYSIIGQGRIAEIISAKSAQRREIFEEAAGISKFRYRKEEAERRLSQSEENLVRLRDILAELEGRVEPLHQQAEKAKEFLKLAQEKKTLEISLWMGTLETQKKRLSEQQEKILIVKNDYERLELESERLEQELTGLYAQSRQMNVQAEEHRARTRELETARAENTAAAAVLQNDLQHNALAIGRAQQQMSAAGQGTAQMEAEIAAKQAELEQLCRELEQAKSRVAAAEEWCNDQRALGVAVEEELRQILVRRSSLQEGLEQIRLEQAASSTRMLEGTERLQALRQGGDAHDNAVVQLQNSIEECSTQLAEQTERMAGLENARKGYLLKREGRQQKQQELQKQAADLRAQAEQKRARMKILQDLEAGMEGFSGSVKYILARSNAGALQGVVGPISSLISVEERYTTAIETALGPALQNMVVQNEDTARNAIRMLRDSKNGRATFLPITSVQGRAMDISALRGQDGFVGLACDLVQFDPQYKGIMAQLLGRVCVVEDLESGTRIAKQNRYQFRIVTLDGQIINAGGSYTGGSTVRSSGVLGRRREIEKLAKEAADLHAKADAFAPRLLAGTEELAALEAAFLGVDGELHSAREEQMRLTMAGEQLQRSLQQARANRDLARKELAELAERLEALRSGEADTRRMIDEQSNKLEGLIAKEEALAARRDALAVGAETAVSALSEQRMVQLAAEKDVSALEAEIRRMREQIALSGSLGEQLKAELEELEKQSVALRQGLAAADLRAQTFVQDIEEANVQVQQTLDKRTQLEGQTAALRAKERELSHGREQVSRELARLEERRSAIQGEYDVIIARLWDEYELTRSQAEKLAEPIDQPDKANRRLTALRGKIRALGAVNVDAIEEYAQVRERYEFLRGQLADVETAIASLNGLISGLTQDMRLRFSESFALIAEEFSKVFVQLFGGGRASLSLTPGEDELSAGVEITVQPPGKVVRNLSLLSGGEQALVAIAIYFAILKVRPAPFCVLDEIEAALDEANVARFAGYLRQMCAQTQFIAITHRRGTMEEADLLYGVTMQEEGVSKLLELKISELESRLGINQPVTATNLVED